MSTQYRLVQSGKTASGGCSAGQGSSEPVAPRINAATNLYYINDTGGNCSMIYKKQFFTTQVFVTF
jgi:hypothetical protein